MFVQTAKYPTNTSQQRWCCSIISSTAANLLIRDDPRTWLIICHCEPCGCYIILMHTNALVQKKWTTTISQLFSGLDSDTFSTCFTFYSGLRHSWRVGFNFAPCAPRPGVHLDHGRGFKFRSFARERGSGYPWNWISWVISMVTLW